MEEEASDESCFPAIEIMEPDRPVKIESPMVETDETAPAIPSSLDGPPTLEMILNSYINHPDTNLDSIQPNSSLDLNESGGCQSDFDGCNRDFRFDLTDNLPIKKRLKHYSLSEKLVAVDLAERTSNNNAAREFHVDRKCIREWRKSKEKLTFACNNWDDGHRKRQRGGGKKPLSNELEKRLLDWVVNELSASEAPEISSRILKLKAIEIFTDLKSQGLIGAETFKGSDGWLEKFMKRHSSTFRSPKVKTEQNS